jgi:hypothetical protein
MARSKRFQPIILIAGNSTTVNIPLSIQVTEGWFWQFAFVQERGAPCDTGAEFAVGSFEIEWANQIDPTIRPAHFSLQEENTA